MLIMMSVILTTVIFFQIIGFLTVCSTNVKLDTILKKLEEGGIDGTRIDNNKKHP